MAEKKSIRGSSAPAPAVMVLSREDAERYQPRSREICISISDPEAAPARLSSAFVAVLQMQFSDVTERGDPTDILFEEEHARIINDFIDRWSDVERLVVHCNMGVSRSPGVALGLCDLRGWATATLERSHPGWNRLVRSVLVRSARVNTRRSG